MRLVPLQTKVGQKTLSNEKMILVETMVAIARENGESACGSSDDRSDAGPHGWRELERMTER